MPPFDFAGYALLAVGMITVSVALDGLSDLSLHHATVLLLLVFGLASLVGYWLRATQQAHPLFAPALFRIPTFSIGLIGNLFARLGNGSMPYLIPLFLQVELGFAPFHAGLMLLPTSLSAMLTKRGVTSLVHRFGYRTVLVANTLLVGGAMASFAPARPRQPAVDHAGAAVTAGHRQLTAVHRHEHPDAQGSGWPGGQQWQQHAVHGADAGHESGGRRRGRVCWRHSRTRSGMRSELRSSTPHSCASAS